MQQLCGLKLLSADPVIQVAGIAPVHRLYRLERHSILPHVNMHEQNFINESDADVAHRDMNIPLSDCTLAQGMFCTSVTCLLAVDSGFCMIVQAWWKPEHLHWEGTDQMLMQEASPSSEGLYASPIDSGF